MQLTRTDKRAVAIVAVVAVLFVAVVGGATALLVRDQHHEERGYLQLAIGDRLVRVDAAKWCDVLLTECAPNRPYARVPVKPGQSVLMSVSDDVASGPWVLYAVYADRDGKVSGDTEVKTPGSTHAQVFTSRPDRVLVNIEIQPLSAVAEGDSYVARGILAVNTAPENMTVADR